MGQNNALLSYYDRKLILNSRQLSKKFNILFNLKKIKLHLIIINIYFVLVSLRIRARGLSARSITLVFI